MKLLVCVILQLVAIVLNALYASGQPEHKFKSCEKSWKQLKQDWQNYSAFPPEAREYLEHCSTEFGLEARERVLLQLGRSLIVTKRYSEAVPILEQCTDESQSMNGIYAGCWEQLGLAAAIQGECDAALTGFNAALAVPATDNITALVHKVATVDLNNLYAPPPGFGCPLKSAGPDAYSDPTGNRSFGTAFFISPGGLLLTNDHVVNGCSSVTLGTGSTVQVVSRDPRNDLAFLKADRAPGDFARFRTGDSARVGEPVLAFGFPLPGTLSSGGVATAGIISSLSGIRDDPRTFQFSAAIQPGNSGG
jgi:S1-C subfamily serine protease